MAMRYSVSGQPPGGLLSIWHAALTDPTSPCHQQPNVIPVSHEADRKSLVVAPASVHAAEPLYSDGPRSSDPGRFYSAVDYHAAYRAGKLTPLRVAETVLPLIRRAGSESGKYSDGWVTSREDEVLAAARASTERYAHGQPLSVLDGVFIGVKDDTEVEVWHSALMISTVSAWTSGLTAAVGVHCSPWHEVQCQRALLLAREIHRVAREKAPRVWRYCHWNQCHARARFGYFWLQCESRLT